MRCSLTSRHCAYLEATWAANDIQQSVDQNGHTNRLTNSPFEEIIQIVRIARLNSLTNRIVLPMARLLWVFWRIRMCIFRWRVRHTWPTWISHFGEVQKLSLLKRGWVRNLYCAKEFLFAWELKSYFHIISFRHLASLWNRGLEQLGNGLLFIKIPHTITRRNKERRGVTCDLNCRQILQLKVQIALLFTENRSVWTWPVKPSRELVTNLVKLSRAPENCKR